MRNFTRVLRSPMAVMSVISPLRAPSFSMTGPMNSVGTSTVSSSMGSSFSPLGPSFMMTLGRVTANS